MWLNHAKTKKRRRKTKVDCNGMKIRIRIRIHMYVCEYSSCLRTKSSLQNKDNLYFDLLKFFCFFFFTLYERKGTRRIYTLCDNPYRCRRLTFELKLKFGFFSDPYESTATLPHQGPFQETIYPCTCSLTLL